MKLKIIVLSIFALTSCSRNIHKSFLTGANVVYMDSVFSADDKSPCTNFLNFSPDEMYPHHTPTRYIRTNVHIMANASGDNNFTLDEGMKYAQQLINSANSRLRKNSKMKLPVGNDTPVLPIKLQLVLVNKPDSPREPAVYLHHDEQLAYFVKSGKHRNTYSRKMYDKYGTQKGEVLNIFLVEHHIDSIPSPTYNPTVDGVGFSEWLKVVGSFQHLYHETKMDDGNTRRTGPNIRSAILNHELGHTLGISHTWNSNDGCDDTPRNPGCWDQYSPACKKTGVFSNNMMDYNNCQCALTPCQIAKIHYNFSRKTSSQSKLLLPTWCEYKPDSTIVIGMFSNVTWDSPIELEGDIIINSGGHLTIQCEVSLPKGAKVIVKPKGTLTLDGGVITNNCGDSWEGIEVWSTRKNEGKVIFSNNPVLENMVNALSIEP